MPLACTPFLARWPTRSFTAKAVLPGLRAFRSAPANARMHAGMAFRSGDSECLLALRSNPAHAKAGRQGVRTRRFRMHADKAFLSGDSECAATMKRRSDANRGVFCVRVETVEGAQEAACPVFLSATDLAVWRAPCSRFLRRSGECPLHLQLSVLHHSRRLSIERPFEWFMHKS